MIECREIGQITISGNAADILAEYAFITASILNAKIDRADVIKSFTTGLFSKQIIESGADWEESWDKIDGMVDEVFGKEVKG